MGLLSECVGREGTSPERVVENGAQKCAQCFQMELGSLRFGGLCTCDKNNTVVKMATYPAVKLVGRMSLAVK